MLLNPQRLNGFFPAAYHEDWLSIIDHIRLGEVAVSGILLIVVVSLATSGKSTPSSCTSTPPKVSTSAPAAKAAPAPTVTQPRRRPQRLRLPRRPPIPSSPVLWHQLGQHRLVHRAD